MAQLIVKSSPDQDKPYVNRLLDMLHATEAHGRGRAGAPPSSLQLPNGEGVLPMDSPLLPVPRRAPASYVGISGYRTISELPGYRETRCGINPEPGFERTPLPLPEGAGPGSPLASRRGAGEKAGPRAGCADAERGRTDPQRHA